MNINDKITVVYDGFLPEKTEKPNLRNGEEKIVKATHVCGCGELHLDVGLLSELNYVSCFKCAEVLPGEAHWCHSGRFKLVQ
jgi:hypothetical protein